MNRVASRLYVLPGDGALLAINPTVHPVRVVPVTESAPRAPAVLPRVDAAVDGKVCYVILVTISIKLHSNEVD